MNIDFICRVEVTIYRIDHDDTVATYDCSCHQYFIHSINRMIAIEKEIATDYHNKKMKSFFYVLRPISTLTDFCRVELYADTLKQWFWSNCIYIRRDRSVAFETDRNF